MPFGGFDVTSLLKIFRNMASESLQLNQEQKQVLTTSALQVAYSSLLEMNAEEVEDRVEREIEANPALEKVEENSDNFEKDAHDNDDAHSDDNDGDNESRDDGDTDDESNEYGGSNDEVPDYDDYSGNDDTYDDYVPRANNRNSDDEIYSPVVADNDVSLAEYLESQLGEFDITDEDREIAKTIIGNIDDAGYLTRSINAMANDIAIFTGEDVEAEDVRRVFDIIRQMDPAGVCATSLGDCLRLQLERIDPVTEDVSDAIGILSISDELASVSQMNAARQQLGLSRRRFDDAMRRIRTLNPKPGNLIGSSTTDSASQIIRPDFDVQVEDSVITVTLLNNIPELQISETFSDETEKKLYSGDTPAQREARKFISTNRNNANLFIRILQMRQSTLFAVMSAIVQIQRDFFLSGDEREIKPMIIRDIKDITGFDISVISRATNGKYAQTPYGIYHLKHFFNERINDDDDTSSHEIVSVIKEIIDSEPPDHPYSDQKITDELRRRGYNVARRTVFKYRENRLKIPSSSKRRRSKS